MAASAQTCCVVAGLPCYTDLTTTPCICGLHGPASVILGGSCTLLAEGLSSRALLIFSVCKGLPYQSMSCSLHCRPMHPNSFLDQGGHYAANNPIDCRCTEASGMHTVLPSVVVNCRCRP
jgi:hypothetical protein